MLKVNPSGRFVPRKFLCKVRKSQGGDGVVKGIPKSLLVAALGQLIANNVRIFMTTASIKTSYRYSSNSICSWDTKLVYPMNRVH